MTRTSNHRRPMGGRGSRRGSGGRAAAPIDPPEISIAGTVAHGEVLTATHNGDTVQWYTDGVAISGETADTYTVDRAETAMGASITCRATNGGGTTTSNALSYYPTVAFRDVFDPALGRTTTGALLNAWMGQGAGNEVAAIADMEPTYSASDAGFNGQPVITFAGADEWMRDMSYDAGAAVADATLAMVVRIDTATTNDIWMSYGGATDHVRIRQVAGPLVQAIIGGTGGAIVNSVGNLAAGAHIVVVTYDLNGTVAIYVDSTTLNASTTATHADLADDGILSIAASNAGAATAAISVGLAAFAPAILTASQLADLVSYYGYRW